MTLSPRLLSNLPREAAVIPLPNPDTTPPVTNTYFLFFCCISLPPHSLSESSVYHSNWPQKTVSAGPLK